jgi:UrcA family protein
MNRKLNRLMIAAPLAAAVGVGAMLAAGPGRALATPQPEVVQYGDLNMTTAAGVQELSHRIRNAAWQVCMELTPPSTGPASIDNVRCQDTLVKEAVDQINNPTLTMMFKDTSEEDSLSGGY